MEQLNTALLGLVSQDSPLIRLSGDPSLLKYLFSLVWRDPKKVLAHAFQSGHDLPEWSHEEAVWFSDEDGGGEYGLVSCIYDSS